MSYTMTHHAEARRQQRGYRRTDLDMILTVGTETSRGILVRRRDVKAEIERLRREIRQLERLMDSFVVMDGGRVVTIYKAGGQRCDAVRKGER